MSKEAHYEYDAEAKVLIRITSEDLPKLMRKEQLEWRDFEPLDEPCLRAIYLGQGCWERLDTVSEQEAQTILRAWGYPAENE